MRFRGTWRALEFSNWGSKASKLCGSPATQPCLTGYKGRAMVQPICDIHRGDPECAHSPLLSMRPALWPQRLVSLLQCTASESSAIFSIFISLSIFFCDSSVFGLWTLLFLSVKYTVHQISVFKWFIFNAAQRKNPPWITSVLIFIKACALQQYPRFILWLDFFSLNLFHRYAPLLGSWCT